jgi:hypothetical protein
VRRALPRFVLICPWKARICAPEQVQELLFVIHMETNAKKKYGRDEKQVKPKVPDPYSPEYIEETELLQGRSMEYRALADAIRKKYQKIQVREVL